MIFNPVNESKSEEIISGFFDRENSVPNNVSICTQTLSVNRFYIDRTYTFTNTYPGFDPSIYEKVYCVLTISIATIGTWLNVPVIWTTTQGYTVTTTITKEEDTGFYVVTNECSNSVAYSASTLRLTLIGFI